MSAKAQINNLFTGQEPGCFFPRPRVEPPARPCVYVQVTEPNRVDYNGTGREKAHSRVGLARETGTLHREPARGTVCNNVITITFFLL